MKIFVDTEYKCHVLNDGTMRGFEVPFFNGKCAVFVEGYRYVPAGETWKRSDGAEFTGEMISPWRDHTVLDAAQREYERQLLAEYAEALRVVGVSV